MTQEETKLQLLNRQKAYQLLFQQDGLDTVIEDLTRFCRGKDSTFHADPRVHAVLEGRREVYLRIRDHLDLDSESFLRKYGNINLIKEITHV